MKLAPSSLLPATRLDKRVTVKVQPLDVPHEQNALKPPFIKKVGFLVFVGNSNFVSPKLQGNGSLPVSASFRLC